jgi:hypothetical protein
VAVAIALWPASTEITGPVAGAALGCVGAADSSWAGLLPQSGDSCAGNGGVAGLGGGGLILRKPALICWMACSDGIPLGL